MRRISLLFGFCGACLTLLAVGAPGARAQTVVNVREFGTPDPINLQLGVYAGLDVTDPTFPSASTGTLAYFLPFPTVTGDLFVLEPSIGGTTSLPSDLLRFVPGATGTLLLVYSDISSSDPADSQADVVIPPNVQANFLQVVETGLNGQPYTEASNGLVYRPSGNDPGALTSGGDIAYNFISDTPEPAMLCLTPALAALLLRNRRPNSSS